MINRKMLWWVILLLLVLALWMYQRPGKALVLTRLRGEVYDAHEKELLIDVKSEQMKTDNNLEITVPVDLKNIVIESCQQNFLYHPLSSVIFDGLHFDDEQREEYRQNYQKYMTFNTELIQNVPELSSTKIDTWQVILGVQIRGYKFYLQCMQSVYQNNNKIQNVALVAMDNYYFIKYGMRFFKQFVNNLAQKLIRLQTPVL